MPLYNVLLETCQTEDYNDSMEDLYFECVNILTLVMNLNNGRYHIPGETIDRTKIRQKAIDAGILVVCIYLMLQTKNEHLKTYIQEEFFEKVDEPDFDYYFKHNHSIYALVSSIVSDVNIRQSIDESMENRRAKLK